MARMSLWEYGALFDEHERRQRQAAAASQRDGDGRRGVAMAAPDDWEPTPDDFAKMRANIAAMGMPDVKV